MKKAKSILLLLFVTGLLNIQAQQAVTTSGKDASGPGGQASYTVGQISYTSNSSSSGSSNQGVQQPYEFFTIGIDSIHGISIGMTVYPNPSTSFVNLKIDERNRDELTWELRDATGKLVNEQKVSSSESVIPMENLANAVYFLKIKNKVSALKVFKIIKNS